MAGGDNRSTSYSTRPAWLLEEVAVMSRERSAYEVHPPHTGVKEKDGRSVRKEYGPWIKLSTKFRDRYLAELKGAQLSVFLCLALHLN